MIPLASTLTQRPTAQQRKRRVAADQLAVETEILQCVQQDTGDLLSVWSVATVHHHLLLCGLQRRKHLN